MYNKFAEFSVKQLEEPKTKCFIYCLICPLTFDIKYVGKTTQGKERFRQHYYQYKKKTDKCAKTKWIQSLRGKGLIFKICYLEYCTEEELNDKEIKWIKLFKDLGEKLFNHTEGGEITFRPKYSEEDKKRISENTKKAMAKPEIREHLRKTHLGKSNPNKGKKFNQEFRDKIHEANMKHSIKIWTSKGEYFESLLAASRAYNCTPTAIKRTLNSHLTRNGVYFYTKIKGK